MKKIKFSILLGVALLVSAPCSVFAQVATPVAGTTTTTTTTPIVVPSDSVPSAMPMLQSKDTLRTYAVEQSARASASISAVLPSGNNAYGFVAVSPTVAGISNSIRAIPLSVDVVNPNDSLFLWASVQNSDGDELFVGYKQFSLFLDKAGYSLPSDYGNVNLALSDNVPIRISGAQAASLYITGNNGKTTTEYSLNVHDGKVYFPRQLAGTNATLGVFRLYSLSDGSYTNSWNYWDVASGNMVQSTRFVATIQAGIQGIVSMTDTNLVFLPVTSVNGIGNNITVEYISSGLQNATVVFVTTEGKSFVGAYVRKAGTTQQWLYPVSAPVGKASYIPNIQFGNGVYYIIPVRNQGDLMQPSDPYYPPDNSGGKG
jgi:hypothetical protein